MHYRRGREDIHVAVVLLVPHLFRNLERRRIRLAGNEDSRRGISMRREVGLPLRGGPGSCQCPQRRQCCGAQSSKPVATRGEGGSKHPDGACGRRNSDGVGAGGRKGTKKRQSGGAGLHLLFLRVWFMHRDHELGAPMGSADEMLAHKLSTNRRRRVNGWCKVAFAPPALIPSAALTGRGHTRQSDCEGLGSGTKRGSS